LQESNFINNMSDKLPMRFLLEQANIGNYNELKEELWTEQYNNAMFDTFLEMDIEKMRMSFMQEMQAAQAEAQGPTARRDASTNGTAGTSASHECGNERAEHDPTAWRADDERSNCT
jgi:hypothetical protein